jgi:hypothetical protein
MEVGSRAELKVLWGNSAAWLKVDLCFQCADLGIEDVRVAGTQIDVLVAVIHLLVVGGLRSSGRHFFQRDLVTCVGISR